MPNDEHVAGGSHSQREADPSLRNRLGDAKGSSGEANVEARHDQASLRFLGKGSNQPAPGQLEEELGHLQQHRTYHSGYSNDARSTGDDSAPPNAGDSFEDAHGTYPQGRTRRTPRQQEQNKMAQQRYRAKRKAHYDELQETVNSLVMEMQASERERRALQDELLSLRRLGVGQNQQIAPALPPAIPAFQASGSSGTEPVKALIQALVARGVLPPHAASLVMPSPAPPPAPQLPPPSSAAVPTFSPETIHQMLGAFKTELWSFLTQNNLSQPLYPHPSPITTLKTGIATAIPPSLLPQATDLINMGIELAKQVLQVSGPGAELLLHDGAPTTHPCAADTASHYGNGGWLNLGLRFFLKTPVITPNRLLCI